MGHTKLLNLFANEFLNGLVSLGDQIHFAAFLFDLLFLVNGILNNKTRLYTNYLFL